MTYSKIPSVNTLLENPDFQKLVEKHGWTMVRDCIRHLLDRTRNSDQMTDDRNLEPEILARKTEEMIKRQLKCGLRRVFNATGTILHTNLGRAPLAENAITAAVEAARGYCNLEISLETGKRSNRYDHISSTLLKLTGSEAAIAVNNNAGAVLLILASLAKGTEVIISRGEMIEIGGGFRIPEVLESSGALLREVGTTNRTHLYDYEKALNEKTGLIFKAHTSNYAVVGFTKDVPIDELVKLGNRCNVPVVYDLGSGNLYDGTDVSYTSPNVKTILSTGVDVVCFSGDKLLGGPQSGIILGKTRFIQTISRHPLSRALRMDKMSLAALDATLKLYFEPEKVHKRIPCLKTLCYREQDLHRRGQTVLEKFKNKLPENWTITLEKGVSSVGGGAMPLAKLDTWVLLVRSQNHSIEAISEFLRHTEPPVLTRIQKDCIVMDIRTVPDDEVKEFADTVINALLAMTK
jgi:L-seryl-tRNA(Ser) seleniumtransferase